MGSPVKKRAKKKSAMLSDLKLTVYEPEQRPATFWTKMGPFFASEEVRRALSTIHDEPENDAWFLAEAHGRVVSFSCLRFTAGGKSATLAHHWAEPEARGLGLADMMMRERMAYAVAAKVKHLRSVVHHESIDAFLNAGFVPTLERTNWVTVEMDI